MILTEKINISVSFTNIKHYSNYFDNLKIGDKIEITPDKLSLESHKIILTKCDICGLEKNMPYREYVDNFNNGGYFTCNKCKYEKSKKTNLEKYGQENYHNIEKYKQTCLEKYGVENTFQNENIKNKIKKNNLEKYGVEFTAQTEHNKQKSKETCLEKYGVESPMQNKEIREKVYKTNLERYGFEHASSNEKIKKKLSDGIKKHYQKNADKFYDNLIGITGDTIELYCPKCKNNFFITRQFYRNRKGAKIEQCIICNPLNSTESSYEKELKEYIEKNYNKIIVFNDKKNIKGELDIYLPELKLAFEFNGLYWHSELFKENNYHLNKTDLCEKQGIKLIHIYEDVWIYKQEIIKSRILNLLGKSNKIMARKCQIKELNNNKIIKEFLEKNHLQGFVGSKIKIGLFYNDELISLMTFGSFRVSMGQKTTEGSYEMLRFCNKLNTNVIGGASRLFKYFIDKYKPIEVISYADRSWSQGNLYEKLEFNLVHKTRPNYYYFSHKKRLYRFNYRKNILVENGADPTKSEHEIMLEKEIFRIYDSGNLKFIWTS